MGRMDIGTSNPRASLFNKDRERVLVRRDPRSEEDAYSERKRANEGNRAIEGSGQRSRGSDVPIKQSRSSVGQSTTLIM